MKHKIVVVLGLLLLTVSAFGLAPYGGKFKQQESQILDTDTWIDANRILMFVTNKGSFAYDQGGFLGKNDGLYYPFVTLDKIADGSENKTVIFAGGIWLGAIDKSVTPWDTLISVAEYADDFFPGPMVGGTFVAGADFDPQVKVYKLYSDSLADNPNADYLNWPVADGAPVDSAGNPEMIGDQMLWSVYNDANPVFHGNDASSSTGLKVEIRQTTFAFAREGALANIVFVKFQIFNKGNIDLKDMFVSLWADPDLGDAGDDFVGCDTALSLGYCFNDGDDNNYGSRPPAVGYDFFQGPLDSTGNLADTAIMWNFTKFPGNRNLPMTSFNKYINGTDPNSPQWTYQYMQGLDAAFDGAPLIDPSNGDTVKFYGLGDPVAGTGWIDVNSSDRRYMLTTGPFDFAPGDSTEIVAAILVGQGSDRLRSITELKSVDAFAQKVYDKEFQLPTPPASPDVYTTALDREILITWGTNSEENPGDLQFEGYSLFQGANPTGPWNDTLDWFDIFNKVGGIIDFKFDPIVGRDVEFVVKPGPNEGLGHFFRTTTDKVNGGPLLNYTEYYFRLEAYTFDTLQPNGEKTLTSATEFTVMPQPAAPGTDFNIIFGDTLVVTKTGISQGSVSISVVDPSAVTGDAYQVVFFDDSILGSVWHVINTSTGDTVLMNWVYQEGGDNYPIVDGMLVKVSGPQPGFLDFQVVANGGGPLSPPSGGALDFGGFPSLRPDDAQQLGAGHWAFHTGDNGGSCAGGDRGSFDAFLGRVMRGDNFSRLGSWDYEMRFTGDTNSSGVYDSTLGGGSWANRSFQDDLVTWMPFELWRTGIDTPNDPSDDVRMVIWHLDFADDSIYNSEAWGCADSAVFGPAGGEHSVSGADNDPFTDWIYWYLPVDDSPGESGYNTRVAEFFAGTYDYGDAEIMARTVLVNWNGGDAPPFNQELPEPGTVFRIITNKANGALDDYTWTTAGFSPSAAAGDVSLLDNIKTVPNPYYLFGPYDKSLTNRILKFTNLPDTCNISIYNLAGEFITTLEKADANTTEATWDLLNDFSVPVASGIYIYVVDAPGIGQKIGKMAIFTEIEILDQY